MDIKNIRNFSIAAHIDHGKSTLADRMLLDTEAITKREFRTQFLDDMDLERERGITIKARAVQIKHKGTILNLIDTPGHVDFTYEVSKSFAACEGVLLLVDSSQGIEAQTMSNLYLAMENDLEIIPIVTKVDLPNADIPKVKQEIIHVLGCKEEEILETSSKTGEGSVEVLDAIVERLPHPEGDIKGDLRALIFDSKYDPYKGVVAYLRVVDGKLKLGDKIRFMHTGVEAEVEELGIFSPGVTPVKELSAGLVGFIACNIKNVSDVKVGDTVTLQSKPAEEALAGYHEAKSMVFCGLYPISSKDFTVLKDALEKLQLNDSSFNYEPETSQSLGFGFRCGFLGLLHMDIIQERLEREFDLQLIITAPSVAYRVTKNNGDVIMLDNPSNLPDSGDIECIEEPFIKASILVPAENIGAIMKLCQDRRGLYKSTDFIDPTRAILVYEIPFSEVVLDFYDKIKSITKGYGSLNYDFIDFQTSKLVKLDVLINEEPVDALSMIVFKDNAYYMGKNLVKRLKDVIPRQLFEVIVQAAVGSRIISRDSVRPLSKNVTAKCYGGDISRKRKLWEKQKEGKKRMKKVGRVDIPQEAFISVLKVND
jgi:GTP-binding protein LepA